MLEPLLTRIRELEQANRRWKTLCAILSVILLAVLTTGTAFLGFHGYRSMLVVVCVYASLLITLVSSFHYIWHAARIIEEPKGKTRVA